MTLKSYPPQDRGRVDKEFFRGEKRITEDDLRGTPSPIDAPADLEAIETVLDDIVAGHREYDQRHLIDADVAPIVHKNIGLTREQAAEPGVWHWLAVIWHPEFVRHRWPWDTADRTVTSMREKFLGAGTDIYSNAFGRLWWMAELSYDEGADDPYRVTREALQVQFLANRLFDPAFARYRPAVVAFAEGLLGESTETIRHANRRFNQALSSIQLESYSLEELRDIEDDEDIKDLNDIVDDVVTGVKEDYDV